MNGASPQTPEKRICSHPGCGKEVIDTGTMIVHAGAGVVEQKCQSCGWKGGQVQKYSQCPRCGTQNLLMDDHIAK